MRRRPWLLWALATATPWPATAADDADDAVRAGRALRFPRDHGAHPGARTEWWYATGWLDGLDAAAPPLGFQVTFFRSRTGLALTLPGRLAPRQLLFAHAALSDLGQRRHLHAQRLARWNGDDAAPLDVARRADTHLRLGRWSLLRDAAAGHYQAQVDDPAEGWALALTLTPTQPVLLQGDAGFSRKGPLPQQASHYYSQPQLAVSATLTRQGRSSRHQGRAWLDHEWSDEILPAGAVGWDWIGMNLDDGGALTAFVLRRADGSALWAGGSHRAGPQAPVRSFGPAELRWQPLRHWASASTGARYPVQWRLQLPAGLPGLPATVQVNALLDAQELDSRASTGTVYWEGLSALQREDGSPLGRGYLEMTGYAGALKL